MKRGEKGFTLVEMMVSLAIGAIILGGVGMGLYHLVTVPDYGNEKLTALHELQNAGHWFSRDGQMAKAAAGGGSLVLTMPDASSVNYTLSGGDLVRSSAGGDNTLAQHIDDVLFTAQGSIVTMQITVAPDGRWGVSENQTYQVCLRVDDV